MHTSLLPHTRHMPCPSHSSRFYHPHNIGWGVQNIKYIIEINFPFLTLWLIIRVIQNFRPNNDKTKYLKCWAVKSVIPCTGHRAKHCAINIKKLIPLRKEFWSSALFTGRTSLMRWLVYNFMTFVFSVETSVRYFGSAADICWHISVALPVTICVRWICSKSVQQNALLKSTTIFHI
jgi:hypothetical protein